MSVANFIPEIWTTGILKERDKVMIGALHCNRDYEGQIKDKGDRVKILTIGDVVSYDYVKNADINAPDQLADEAQWIDIDQGKYCHVFLDDVDKTQANQEMMKEGQRKLGIRMADDVDQYIFGKYGEAGLTIDGYTVPITSANIITYLASIRQKFKEANVPESEPIYLEMAPAVYTKFVLARIAKETANTGALNSGSAGNLYGIELCESNNIVFTGGRYKNFARTKAAISYASQLTENVAYKPERRFGDAIKSLQVWGAKVVRPKEFMVFDTAIGAEA
jgi:hypothetical protein